MNDKPTLVIMAVLAVLVAFLQFKVEVERLDRLFRS